MNEKIFELLDFIPVPMYLKDIQGYYLACNILFAEMLNAKKEDIIGKNVYEFLDPQTASVIREKDLELFEDNGKEQNFQYRLIIGSALYDISFYKKKIIGSNGVIKGLVGLIFDVSEFNKEKEKLYIENNKLFDFAKSLNKVSMIVDSDGKYIDIFSNDDSNLANDKINVIGKYLFEDYGEVCANELAEIIKSTINNKSQQILFKEISINNKKKNIEIKTAPMQLLVSSKKAVAVVINEIEDESLNYSNNFKIDFEISRRSKILNDIVNEEYSYEKSFIDMVRSVGIDLRRKLICLLISVNGLKGSKQEIIKLLSNSDDIVVWDCDKFIGVYFYAKENSTYVSQTVIDNIQKIILQRYGKSIINIGVSGVKFGLRSLQEGFNEAELALSSLLQQPYDNGEVCRFEELGILQLLVGCDYNKEFICQFIDSKIGKIIRYDQEKNTELLETLEELIYVDNLKKVAEKLYLHHKTVVFRKQRIEQILEVSIDSFDVKMTLATAIKLYKLNKNKCKKLEMINMASPI